MELHTFRYPNLLSAILGEFFSIRFQPHQAVLRLGFDLFKRVVFFTNSFFEGDLFKKGDIFKRVVISRVYGNFNIH